ncbi:hypothetical protein QSV36_18800 [Pseudomonas sp. BCRC 81390]|uniref:hypothetical protein n=1 Tax=Pseudomonas sp. BCRC 81390 TaxID=3054778 RepID=UPI0025954267|nr:hypothetical protein [Pseudomonas sp. BCRC 81390]MDM3887626.1 hypothetical protein [Pseudomonas sp. BCRC 81390]
MNATKPPFVPPYAAWNTPRLDNIARLREYCLTLEAPEDFGRQQWAVQALAQVGQPTPTSAAALQALRLHLGDLQELLLDHLIRHSADAHPLLSTEQNRLIAEEMAAAFEPGQGILFDAILAAWGEEENIQDRFHQPATLLADAEQAPCMRDLVARVQQALQWFGSDGSEPQSPILRLKLLRHCLALALAPDNDLLGFDFTSPSHAGMTIDEIFTALDEHLLRGRALTQHSHLTLARYLLMPRFPAAWQISDLPGEMVYRSSARWVHFQSAVNLGELLSPGDTRRKSSTEILLLPHSLKKRHPVDFAPLFESASNQPVLEWAVANAKIAASPNETFSEADVNQAYADFQAYQMQLLDCVAKLSIPMPVRFEMAKAQLRKHGIDPETPCYSTEPIRGAGGFVTSDRTHSRPAWEVYTSGDFATWNPLNSRSLAALGLPDISARFERDFDTWLASFETALKWQLTELLAQLPVSERHFIEQAELELFQVRVASGRTVSHDETTGISHLVGRAGLLIRVLKSGKRRCYEVFPWAGEIVRRGDFKFSEGGQIRYPEPFHGNPLGSNTHSGWHSGTRQALDWDAYQGLALPRSGQKSSVIIQRIAHIPGGDSSFRQLLERFASVACATHFLADTASLRQQAKGMTDSEAPNRLYTLLKAAIPFWKPVEDILQGVREDRPGLVRQGIGTGLMDLIMIGAPLRQIGSASRVALQQLHAAALRTLITGSRSGLRAAYISARLCMPALTRSFTRLSIVASHNIAGMVIPFYGLVHLLGSAGPKILQLTASALRQLRNAVKTVRKTLDRVNYSAGMTQVKPTLAGDYPGKQPGYQLRRVEQCPRVVTQWVHSSQESASALYLVDLHTARPYGPRLVEIDDFGSLSLRPPEVLPINSSGAAAQIVDSLPGLSKQWVRWGDDLFLQSNDLLYKRVGMQLQRVDPASLQIQKPLANLPRCRRPRYGRGRTVCLIGSGTFPREHTPGRDVVPWFNDRTVQTRNYKYVFDGKPWRLRNLRPVPKNRALGYDQYNPTLVVEVLGGNEVFKAIKIRGGIYTGFSESHTLSAVLAPRRSDGVTFLVTRVDPGVYYSGRWSPGDGAVTLVKFRPSSPIPASPDENDTLALIYAGSYDAHVKILPLSAEELDAQLAKVTQHLANYRGLPQFDVFMSNHFDMGTTAAQAALYCHFTQLRLNQTARATATSWGTVSRHTASPDLNDIATQLNRILSPRQRWDIDRITRPTAVRAIAGQQNLAYLKLTFNTTPTTSAVYFSVSGHAGNGFETKLTRFLKGADSPIFSGWRREGNVAVGPDGTRYIDAQPTRGELRRRKPAFALPDTSTPWKFVKSNPNPRMRDSENHILERLKADGIDFESISSATLYSKLPVCPSCTEVLFKLQSLMRNGSLRVFEGLPNTP